MSIGVRMEPRRNDTLSLSVIPDKLARKGPDVGGHGATSTALFQQAESVVCRRHVCLGCSDGWALLGWLVGGNRFRDFFQLDVLGVSHVAV